MAFPAPTSLSVTDGYDSMGSCRIPATGRSVAIARAGRPFIDDHSTAGTRACYTVS